MILNFASNHEGTESRKLIYPAIQPQQSSFLASTHESGHISGKFDYNTWTLPEKSQCCSSLIVTLTCPGSSVTTSSLHTAHLHALCFFQKCSRKHFNTQCLPGPSSSWQLLEITNGVWILSVHLNRNDLMIKISHCLKIAGSLNWKKQNIHFQNCKYNWHYFVPLLAISLERPTTTVRQETSPEKESFLDIYLSHIWGTIAKKWG